jgi:hypothetical protein
MTLANIDKDALIKAKMLSIRSRLPDQINDELISAMMP